MAREEISGSIGRVMFQRDGFLIAALESGVKVLGPLLSPRVGMEYTFVGNWQDDPRHGRQFRFTDHRVQLPATKYALVAYLEEYCPWVGRPRANLIWDAFGEKALDVLRDEPERAAEAIPGITIDRAREIAAVLGRDKANETLRLRLLEIFGSVRIPRLLPERVAKKWGADAPDMILANPYDLIRNFRGVGFTTADAIAGRNGYDRRSAFRIHAGLVHALEEQAASGDVCVSPYDLAQIAASDSILGLEMGIVEAGLRSLLEAEDQVVEDQGWVYLTRLLADEKKIADRLTAMLAEGPAMEYGEAADPAGLAADQVAALEAMRGKRVFLLTGAPGVGKTFLLRKILETLGDQRIVSLCAPTGKAAKRMTEQCGRNATTIHSLLRAVPDDDGEFEFANAQLAADAVIVDETSMLDVSLFARLLEAVRSDARLILVGDQYQLPSVGPGNVLRSMLESGVIPWYELSIIKRQDPKMLIVRNCSRIKDGQDIEVDNASADFFFVHEKGIPEIRDSVVDLVARRLPDHFNLDPMRDIQVITATRKQTEISCEALNAAMQRRMNPGPTSKLGEIRVGDRVIQTRNERIDSETWIANGDLGRVLAVDEEMKRYHVAFENPERMVWINSARANLDLAYCLTVHKFQGSEAPVVVLPIHRAAGPRLLQRRWIYTAISRARRACVIVGSREDVRRAIQRVEAPRRTLLKERLVKAVDVQWNP